MSTITILSGDWPASLDFADDAGPSEALSALTPQQRAIFDRECKRLYDEGGAGVVSLEIVGGAARSLRVTRTLAWDKDLDLEEIARRIAASTGYGAVGIDVAAGVLRLTITTSVKL